MRKIPPPSFFTLSQQSMAAVLVPEIFFNPALQDINILVKFSALCCAYSAPYNARPPGYSTSQS